MISSVIVTELDSPLTRYSVVMLNSSIAVDVIFQNIHSELEFLSTNNLYNLRSSFSFICVGLLDLHVYLARNIVN